MLQLRLNPRTHSEGVVAPSRHVQILLCHVGAETFGIDLAGVRQLRRLERFRLSEQRVGTSIGVLEGSRDPIPVHDLAALLGQPRPESLPGSGRILELRGRSGPWGLRVDRVSKVVGIDEASIRPMPRVVIPEGVRRRIRGLVDQEGEPFFLLSSDQLLSFESQSEAISPEPARALLPSGSRVSGRLLLFMPPDSGLVDSRRPVVLGLSLSHVLEVLGPRPTFRLPGVAPHVQGLTVYNGHVVPVLDLGRRVAQADPNGLDPRNRLILVRAPNATDLFALRAGSMIQVLSLPVPHQPSCRPLAIEPHWLKGVFELRAQTLAILDVARLSEPS